MTRQARLEDFPLRAFDKLRYGDTDRQGHVNNAVFATLLETGRVEMAYEGDKPLMDPGCAFVIARLELDYLAEMLWPGRVDIGTRVQSIGRSSLKVEQALFQSERLVAWAETVLVQVNETTRKSQALSEQSIAKLKRFIGSPARQAEPEPGAKATVAYSIRKAVLDDRGALETLIARSARELTLGAYTPRQIETALRAAFGVDTQLIQDGTYLVAEVNGSIVGCGGWSRRRTLFGGDAQAHRDSAELNPERDAAKIRAFFVDPAYARKGIGHAILGQCEAQARRAGFRRFELMAMLSGVDFYRAHGYAAGPPVQYELQPGLTIEFVPMSKSA
ncbi:MAG TPA: GNAT family N-acetyltransferase [Burkholderiaceae bacterium]|nr:GNAT family N-acetyltransferase [Burkholderiaceae bacterium]